MNAHHARLLDDLAKLLPAGRLLTDRLERTLYATDASYVSGMPTAVAVVETRQELSAVVAACSRHGVPFTGRGAGTALTGSAAPLEESVVVSTARMDRILSIDPVHRVAWVEPGVVNAALTTAVAGAGLHYAPDPSSQESCTIGGNIATNAGGAHTLLHGVTTSHVLALDIVLPDGRTTRLGSLAPEEFGPDLTALFVGSEGTMGMVAAAAVRLTPLAETHETLLFSFTSVGAAGAAVTAMTAAGLPAAALEFMDRAITVAVEAALGMGLPTEAEALLLVEFEGEDEAVRHAARAAVELVDDGLFAPPARATSAAQRAGWWKARKHAVGAMAHVAPNYYLHDTVIPRTALVPVLAEVGEISRRWRLPIVNVFHAGDGNLHPIIAYDRRRPGEFERVLGAGEEIIRAALRVGGSLTGEHGIGVEKLDFMALQFDESSLALQQRLREAFDPARLANPGKVLPTPGHCREATSAR